MFLKASFIWGFDTSSCFEPKLQPWCTAAVGDIGTASTSCFVSRKRRKRHHVNVDCNEVIQVVCTGLF
ncbi:hypothetical protein DPMN_144537 [Dreissena polymorpha]|uniref:Uncharacterized protein n=1 Tax=Dreissena polymorpha TaxID=45954 RepID=A0A9D4GFM1_DREPO|nr:hypothetical protein DPMN_144537 [Dreissena polymorpha]